MNSEFIIPVLIAVAFLVGSGALLAGMLVFAERKILNFGPCTIDINGGDKKLQVLGGSSLLSLLAQQGIFIPSACGGRGSCAYCKVVVEDGGGPIGPIEEPYLSPEERKKNVRLSCQVKVRSDIRIQIPKEFFSVKRYLGTVSRKRNLTHDTVELQIKLDEPPEISFTAGQYVQLESGEYSGHDSVMRAYSISSAPSDINHVELIIRKVPNGICTTWVFDVLKEGQRVNVSGPFGNFGLRDTDATVIFIAGGSGMAPIWSILKTMNENHSNRKALYFFGAQSQRDLFFTDELKQLEAALPNFRYIPALSNEPPESNWSGERGLITDVVDKHVTEAVSSEAYLCGSPGMIDACIKVLSKKGMPQEKIYYDKFA